ncbi:PAM68-like protein (DUF3464) [Carex rostrata]
MQCSSPLLLEKVYPKPRSVLPPCHFHSSMASSLTLSLLPISSSSRNLLSPPPSINSNRLRPPPLAATKRRKRRKGPLRLEEEATQEYQREENLNEQEDDRDATIPQVVTDRMMRRMGLSVGIPLSLGLSFFPFFYYLKKVLKIDVPTWIPFGVSFFFFGSALLGVSYGIVSASWDPLREGSLIGWNEARRNWPVFWESLRGKKD